MRMDLVTSRAIWCLCLKFCDHGDGIVDLEDVQEQLLAAQQSLAKEHQQEELEANTWLMRKHRDEERQMEKKLQGALAEAQSAKDAGKQISQQKKTDNAASYLFRVWAASS